MYEVLKKDGRAILTFDISDDADITKKHGIDGKQPKDYNSLLKGLDFN